MKSHAGLHLMGAAAALSLALASGGAQADAELGSLTCSRVKGGGFNLLIVSKAPVRCTFEGSAGAEQWYQGSTGVALGVDLKWTAEETIYFAVISSTRAFVPEGDFLSGNYGGAKADAAVGVGAGAALLVGGNDDTISLQPAFTAGTGAGVAAGLGYLNLEPDPLNEARLVTPRGSLFEQAAYSGYFNRAFDYRHRPDYEGSDYFSAKAIAAGSGAPLPPDAETTWDLPSASVAEAAQQRTRLLAALQDTAGAEIDAGLAQANYDCWLYALGHDDAETATVCRAAYEAHLEAVERAVAEQDLMKPSWFMVLFDTDVSGVSPQASLEVDNVLRRINQLSDARVYVMGNADRAGRTAYNQELSDKRAQSVKAALLAAGVKESWIATSAYGDTNPISISRNPHDALNRRVDVLVEPLVVKPEAIAEEAGKKAKN